MIQRDYLIIGGGIAGSSVCEGIRKFDKRGSVTLVGGETFHPYKRWSARRFSTRTNAGCFRSNSCATKRPR